MFAISKETFLVSEAGNKTFQEVSLGNREFNFTEKEFPREDMAAPFNEGAQIIDYSYQKDDSVLLSIDGGKGIL